MSEIKELREEVMSRDKSLEPVIDKLLEKYGLSTQALKDEADERWEWANYESPERKPSDNQ
jgi:hypothetical protein